MKPEKLEVTNFLGLKKISLTFPPQGVFVITGPNGAGKSSILEAIYFALYGKTMRLPGDVKNTAIINRNARHSTDNPARAEVIFTFSQQGRKYLIRRELERNTKKVDDSTHNAWFFDLDGPHGDVPETGVTKVNKKIEDVLGLNPEVFASTVFLGQGRITDLVEAKPDKRRKIFDSILETHNLSKMQALVRGDLQQVQARVESLTEEYNQLREGPSADELRQQLSDVLSKIEEIRRQLEQFEQMSKRFEEIHQVKSDMEKTQNNINVLKSQIEELRYKAYEDANIKLAKELRVKYIQLEQDEAQFEQLKLQKQGLEENAKRFGEIAEKLSKDIESLHHRLEELGEEQQLEDELSYLEHSLQELNAARSKLDDAFNTLMQCRTLSSEMLTLLAEEKTLKKDVSALDKLLRFLDERRGVFEKYYEAKQEIKKLEDERAKNMEEANKLQRAYQQLNSRMQTVNAEFPNAERDFLVSRIVETLSPQDECPICGNEITELKTVSLPDELLLEFGQLEMQKYHVEQQLKKINEHMAELENRLSELQAVVSKCQEHFTPNLSARIERLSSVGEMNTWIESQGQIYGDRRERLAVVQQQLYARGVQLRAQNERLKSLCSNVEIRSALHENNLQDKLVAMEKNIKMTEQKIAALSKQITDLKEMRQSITVELAKRGGELNKTQESKTETEKALKELNRRIDTILSRITDERSLLKNELLEKGLTMENYESLKNRDVQGADDKLKMLMGSLDQLQNAFNEKQDQYLSLLADVKEEGDLNSVQSQLQSANETYKQLLKESGSIEDAIKHAVEREQRLKEKENQRALLEEELSVLTRLWEDLKADRFPDFYRGEMMNEIVTSASNLLWEMSGGQFNLIFDSDSFRFDVVFDDGLTSDISNLSGGEKVLVALSLAFAISQHFAGSLESIFLDEGLAWLDKENNTKLAQYLQNMENSSMVVGIVTHSEEFAINFQRRLYVNGGTAQWT
ncbi:AAA family ATPase [Coprothermobacter platensis]|uniref:AAA family ATPase n=1 Tax=Coprothermobacter platensis TaxID=108819 RepID=UPI000378C368|nr:SMC family ATPase [Coprothermobacter platensis]